MDNNEKDMDKEEIKNKMFRNSKIVLEIAKKHKQSDNDEKDDEEER